MIRKRRPKRISSAATTKRKLDALCRLLVLTRDRNRCLRCGEVKHLQWCHVYSRRYLSLRWDPRNSMALCAGCHLWWHHRPMDAAKWADGILPQIGSSREILAARLNSGTKVNLDDQYLWLKYQLEKAGIGVGV